MNTQEIIFPFEDWDRIDVRVLKSLMITMLCETLAKLGFILVVRRHKIIDCFALLLVDEGNEALVRDWNLW